MRAVSEPWSMHPKLFTWMSEITQVPKKRTDIQEWHTFGLKKPTKVGILILGLPQMATLAAVLGGRLGRRKRVSSSIRAPPRECQT